MGAGSHSSWLGGEREATYDHDFFEAGGVPSWADGAEEIEVRAVWAKVEDHLRRIARGFRPRIPQRAAKEIVAEITNFQGIKLLGTHAAEIAAAADEIAAAVQEAKKRQASPNPPPLISVAASALALTRGAESFIEVAAEARKKVRTKLTEVSAITSPIRRAR